MESVPNHSCFHSRFHENYKPYDETCMSSYINRYSHRSPVCRRIIYIGGGGGSGWPDFHGSVNPIHPSLLVTSKRRGSKKSPGHCI